MTKLRMLGLRFCLAALLLALGACSSSNGPADSGSVQSKGWIGAWGAAPYGPYPLGPLTGAAPVDPLASTTVFLDDQAVDQSFRMIVHPTIGGDTVRIRLSNLLGTQPVTFDSVQVAVRAAGPAIIPTTEKAVPFGGSATLTLEPGAEGISDPVAFSYSHGDSLAISFHVVGESGPMTWHAVAFSANYVSAPMTGDTTADPSGASFSQVSAGWFFISGVDVLAPDSPGTIVAIGDSITDGAYIVPESNTRWPDFLAQRLAAAGIAMGVVNQGINSNTVTPVSANHQGPPAVNRFERDVLQRPGVRSVIIFEGTNDLAAGVKAPELYTAIRSLVDRAHAAGLCVVVGTILPRSSSPILPWDATQESERQALNELLRADTSFEGVADFDKAMASPLDPTQPNPAYFWVDGLHPITPGFMVMADAVPLDALVPAPMGKCTSR